PLPYPSDEDTYSVLRRHFLQQLFTVAGGAFMTPPLPSAAQHPASTPMHVDIDEFIHLAEANLLACWRLMSGDEIVVVPTVLIAWLPRIDALLRQPSQHRYQLAALATQGYILAGLVTVLQRQYD